MVSKKILIESGNRESILRSKLDGTKSLNGKYVKVATNSFSTLQSYLDLSKLVLTDNPGSDIPVGDENFRNVLYNMTDFYIDVVRRTYVPEVLENDAVRFPEALLERFKTSKSEFLFTKLVDTLREYYDKRKSRKQGIPLTDMPRKIYLEHCVRLSKSIRLIQNLPLEEQHDMLLSYLPANKNAGWPFFFHQTKKNYVRLCNELFSKVSVRSGNKYLLCADYIKSKVSGDHYEGGELKFITADVVLAFAEWIVMPSKTSPYGYTPPYIMFYRTQGGKETKVRAVFGGWFGLKIIGTLVSAAKHHDFEMPRIGRTKWIAAENWDIQFDLLAQLMEEEDHLEWVGEDFSGFDQSIRPDDISWVFSDDEYLTKAPEYMKLVTVGFNSLVGAGTWVGKRRIPGFSVEGKKDDYDVDYIFFNSGNPFTSEFGSLVHLMISSYVSEVTGWKLIHATYLSDDNLCAWSEFDIDRFFEIAVDELGFATSVEKTFIYSRDGVVSFLKNLIGPLLGLGEMVWAGDPTSRWYNMLHSERDVETDEYEAGFSTWEVLNPNIPLNRTINQILSKLGSNGRIALPIITEVINHKEFRNTLIGSQVVQAIYAMKVADRKPKPSRPDLPSSISPEVLTEIDFSALRIKGADDA